MTRQVMSGGNVRAAPRPGQWSPIPSMPRGATLVDKNVWGMDVKRRLASGASGSGLVSGAGAGGDYKPGPQFLTVQMQPFVAQPGGQRRGGFWNVTKGHQASQNGTAGTMGVYGPAQYGGPQNPRQPYRANAGVSVQVRMFPHPLPIHLAGGSHSIGQPATKALTQQVAALLKLRAGGMAQTPTRVQAGSLSGTGIGTRQGMMVGIPYSR